MRNNRDMRSPIRRWIDRKKLTIDSGAVVLALLAAAILLMLGLRVVRQAHPSIQASSIAPAQGEPGVISGIARIVDGDTLEVMGIKIRLFGIDAPEDGQVCRDLSNNDYGCGGRASAQLESLIGGHEVSCLPRNKDRYGRTVAVCSVAGNDLGAEIVSLGWAVAFERYSRDYVDDENHAREQRLGMWRGSFERPSEYRADKRNSH